MKKYLEQDEWCIIEKGFHPDYNRVTESIFSLGNGRMGQRGNFEEQFSGDSLQGNYVAGIYYPDKTRVGWWKNGYPEYFAKVLNAANWIGIDVFINGNPLDIARCEVLNFKRILNMKEGFLQRSFIAKLDDKHDVKITSKRFLSIVDDEAGVIRYSVTPLTFDGEITFVPYIDFDVINEDANYDEKFWDEVEKENEGSEAYITAKTKKLDFHVCTGMKYDIFQDGKRIDFTAEVINKEKYVANSINVKCRQGQQTDLVKLGCNLSSENHKKSHLIPHSKSLLKKVFSKGYDQMLEEQIRAWNKKWELSDIEIKGDISAQQGIRFNIFQLNQTYTGEDERLNIGPKGFTGEKYGGSTYWDTEAYCIPFYLSTSTSEVPKNLLLYRYKHLPKAIENAEKLGFKNGAALYPMVTMNGEECHNEWEITFEEIHRNGAIAYAIYNYINYTGDNNYLIDYGLEVLIGISRFWSQRVNYSEAKNKYVMLGVTGPNEYENNINNNWYTSKIACWTMQYTIQSIDYIKNTNKEKYKSLIKKLDLDEKAECKKWKDIIENMYFPEDKERKIYLQQEGYLDKELIPVSEIPENERPLNQNWSWDRILRSCYIKQADVLQGLFFFEDEFDNKTIKRHFDFYEPFTVHESSLSPCIHCILAARLKYYEKAYEMYLRTARLDLDDYNNDTNEGCHITSMAGTWMAIIYGFGGMRVKNDIISFNPFLPKEWRSYSFKIYFRESILSLNINKKEVVIENHTAKPLKLNLFDRNYSLAENESITVPHE